MKNPFFITFLGFTQYWVYKPNNAFHTDSPRVNTGDEIIKLSTKDKVCSKCDTIDGSVVSGWRQPIFFGFVLDKPPESNVLSEHETIHYKNKTNPCLILLHVN